MLGLRQGTGFNRSTLRAHSDFTWGVCAHAVLSAWNIIPSCLCPGNSYSTTTSEISCHPLQEAFPDLPSHCSFLETFIFSLSSSSKFQIWQFLYCTEFKLHHYLSVRKKKMLPIKLNMTACLFFFFFFFHTRQHAGSYFPNEESNLRPLQWKHSLNHWATRAVPRHNFLITQNYHLTATEQVFLDFFGHRLWSPFSLEHKWKV